MSKKKLAIALSPLVALAVCVGVYFFYWSYHPHICIYVPKLVSPAEEDYRREWIGTALSEHRGIPTAASVEDELMRMADWNDQVITELYTYTTPYDIRVSGKNEDGRVTLRYAGYVTDQTGQRVDYQREETFDLPVRDEDFRLPAYE